MSAISQSPQPKNHGDILRASVFTGGAQVVTSLASLVRGKFAAVFLGVAGVGVGGLLTQALWLIQSFAGLGVGASGVRAIAVARGKGDQIAIRRVYTVVRAWSWGTGLATVVICCAFSQQLSLLTFDSADHANDFVFVGMAVLFQQLSNGQSALLRGLGKIKELSALNALSAVLGLALTVPCYILLGLRGIAPALMLVTSANLACTWWYVRRETVPWTGMGVVDILKDGGELAYVGMAIVGTSVAGSAASYITGLMIRSEIGLEGSGFYQAASGLTIVMVGFVLSAMGQDYYPRLAAVIHKKDEAAALIRDQTEMALLMGTPILVCVSALAPLLLRLAFSEHFLAAAPAVTWLALGCLLRIVSWPLGYALLAEGRPMLILSYELAFSALTVLLSYIGLSIDGLNGAAASFAVLYLIYWFAMMRLVRKRVGYLPGRSTLVMVVAASGLVVVAQWLNLFVGAVTSVITGAFCVRVMLRHLDSSHQIYVLATKLGPIGRVLGVRPAGSQIL